MLDTLRRNLDAVRRQIAAACERAGRSADAVTLVAVTKYAELDWVRGLYELGLRDFGESRPQQLVERVRQLPADIRWHMIGHLQRNKAALVLPHVALIHSVDSLRLLDQLRKDAEKLDLSPRVLLEVNVSGEASKDGFTPDVLRSQWEQLWMPSQVQITGLMTMAPLADDPAAAQPHFHRLRELRDELAALSGGECPLPELSMGMSGDFPAGIAEGATLVRIGSALFAGL